MMKQKKNKKKNKILTLHQSPLGESAPLNLHSLFFEKKIRSDQDNSNKYFLQHF